MITNILFDLDGVLVEARHWHYLSLNKALSCFGKQYKINLHEHKTIYNGLSTSKKLDMLIINKQLPVSFIEEIKKLKQEYTIEYIEKFCKPKKHIINCLTKLERDGYKLAVCSNSIRNSIKIMLEKSEIIDKFDFYLSNEDVIKQKPDPEIYKKAMEHYKVSTQNCLIIEDSDKGIAAARASGGHLLVVSSTKEVTYKNIYNKIKCVI